MDDDFALVTRLREGDEAAFVELVRRYQPSLLRVARSLIGTSAVAEEVVQDTWLGVLRGVDRFEGRSSFKTWLFRILFNRARTTGQREHRVEPVPADDLARRFDSNGAWSEPPVPWSDQADDRVVAGRLARRVHDVLPTLPDSQRRVVVLRDVEGLPAADVTALLGITDGHQRVLLHRARNRIRQELEAEMSAS